MVKIFLQAGGEGKLAEDFCHEIHTLKRSVSDKLLKIRFMTKDDANHHMVQKSLTFHAICEAVEIQYCTFKDQKEWLLAKNVRDSKAPTVWSKFCGRETSHLHQVHGIDVVQIWWRWSEQAMI
jgi:hypothetical protein